MTSFDYFNPVKILFGDDKIELLASEIGKVHRKIMLTYGQGSIKKNGTYERIMRAIEGFDVVEFGGIEANPKYETLMRAVELARSTNTSFMLAVGGGSVIDGTKFISAAIPCSMIDPWDLLTKRVKVESAIPFGAVLTLPATGSEMNSGAVISHLASKEKLVLNSPLLFPKFSILDPTLTYSLPHQQIANGIVDAFIHVGEQYITFPSNAQIQDRFAESIMQTLIDVGPKTLNDPTNYQHRANFVWACTMALNGLIATGVPEDWATHMIGHEMTALFGLDHGVTLAIIYPALLRVMKREKHEKLMQYGIRVLGADNTSSTETIIDKTEEFFRSLGLNTRLPEYNISLSDIKPIIKRFEERRWKLGENRNITPDVVEQIFSVASKPYLNR